MNLRRYIQAGAIWGWPLSANPLQEARDRYTVTGNPTLSRGSWGNALTLDGANDYFTLTTGWEDQLRFDAGTLDFSIVAWVRRAVTGVAHTILDKRDAGGDGWVFDVLADDRLRSALQASVAYGPVVIADALWHSAIAVVDRSVGFTVYLDGAAGTPVAAAAVAMATTTPPRIGARSYDGGNKWNGDIAGIFGIPRVLSPAECDGIAHGRAF